MIKGLEILFSNLEVKIGALAYKLHLINNKGEKGVFKFYSSDLLKKTQVERIELHLHQILQ